MAMRRTCCGWCMTGDHENCKKEINHYDKTWYCLCEICNPEKDVVEIES